VVEKREGERQWLGRKGREAMRRERERCTEKGEIQLDGMQREERRGKMGMGDGVWEVGYCRFKKREREKRGEYEDD
jgi:hypothetical protein